MVVGLERRSAFAMLRRDEDGHRMVR
jgi:hypothetical protein